MTSLNIAALMNLLGFTTGVALYAMLLLMVLRNPAQTSPAADSGARTDSAAGWLPNGLLLAASVLGLLWNTGALVTFGARDFGSIEPLPLILAISFTALGFLPAVVVHSAVRSNEQETRPQVGRWITLLAYGLSAFAAALHFYAAATTSEGLSLVALRVLTVGYIALIVALFLSTRRQTSWKRAVWASALAVFAVSALHLSHHHDGVPESWFRELTGHHASLPLALAILYQDYRFAFADIFLKRALALLSLVAAAFGLYVLVAAPLLGTFDDARPQLGPRAVGLLLGLWVATALLYPYLRRAIGDFVDKVVLRRVDYDELRAEVSRLLTENESSSPILDGVCRRLRPALSAREVRWLRADAPELAGNSGMPEILFGKQNGETPAVRQEGVTLLEHSARDSAVVFVPTTEPPFYAVVIGALAGGRRLLSDDVEMLKAVALMTARRIDVLRVTHERCEQVQREQEISKLATEAQLKALRAQINPHFLFNALTTIGYLIQTTPERALETLLKLTSLLRGVLRASEEFVTLGEELKLTAAYLDIERARFEDRLRVRIDVPPELQGLRIPPLVIQPLVENAVKHGISPA
ncbi:MAG: histidine kinase, partial [Rubrivivax sp.]|nr:histidine kinase [Pyrinomonadaceae bacterium]